MEISAQISIYPLRQEHLTPAMRLVRTALEERGLVFETGRMRNPASGDTDLAFDDLKND